MYKIAPVLTEYVIEDPKIMYNVKPIQKIDQAGMGSTDLEKEQDRLFEQIEALSNRVSTVLSVLAKSGAPKSTHGIKYVDANAPLDIVININPKDSLPKGLVGLHKKLSERFTTETKVFVHSSATGYKTDLFQTSKPFDKNTRRQFQVIFTVIFTTAVPETTCFVGSSKLTGCSIVTRFIGRLLDIYPVEGKDEATVEEWLEIADIIADPTTNKKERMYNRKPLVPIWQRESLSVGTMCR